MTKRDGQFRASKDSAVCLRKDTLSASCSGEPGSWGRFFVALLVVRSSKRDGIRRHRYQLKLAKDFSTKSCSQAAPQTKVDVLRDRSTGSVHQGDLNNSRVIASRSDNGITGVTGDTILAFLPRVEITLRIARTSITALGRRVGADGCRNVSSSKTLAIQNGRTDECTIMADHSSGE